MITFKIWTHPTSGEKRIYISGLASQGSSKCWIYQSTPAAGTNWKCDFKITAKSDARVVDTRKVAEIAEQELLSVLDLASTVDTTFEELLTKFA